MTEEFFTSERIDRYAFLPFTACEVTDKARLDRILQGKPCRAVCVFLIPYRVESAKGNLSRYAHARDYHLYFEGLCERAQGAFPAFLTGLADRSPIHERSLALKAGLGVRGKNGLLLNETYGSFCFIGVLLFSELPQDAVLRDPLPARDCVGCGACLAACPTQCLTDPKKPCLSALTQAKRLTEEEEELLKRSELIWGCDRCQEVCPVNRGARQTPIPFFKEDLIESLTEESLNDLIETGEWARRAYAWRGKDVLFRNLKLCTRARTPDTDQT